MTVNHLSLAMQTIFAIIPCFEYDRDKSMVLIVTMTMGREDKD